MTSNKRFFEIAFRYSMIPLDTVPSAPITTGIVRTFFKFQHFCISSKCYHLLGKVRWLANSHRYTAVASPTNIVFYWFLVFFLKKHHIRQILSMVVSTQFIKSWKKLIVLHFPTHPTPYYLDPQVGHFIVSVLILKLCYRQR